MTGRVIIIVASLLAFLGVGIGAFGAHALKETLISNGYTDTFKTASFYHLVHALALFMTGLLANTNESLWLRRAAYFFLAGVLLFSGSLYTLSISGITKLGMITPLGGLSFMLGWLSVVVSVLRSK